MELVVPDWLNAEFMERALRQGENDDSIKIVDMTIKPATSKGDNYTSEMHRCTVEFTRDQRGEIVSETRPIIVKVAPTTEGAHKDMITQAGIFKIEIEMMTTALKDMQALLPETKICGKCLYSVIGDPSVVVIEDLAPLGYRMACREAGLDLKHCLLALKGLAKFHAASVAAYEKKPEYKTMFNKGMFNNINPPELTFFFVEGMKNLGRVVGDWPELGKTYGDKITRLAGTFYARTAECRLPIDAEFNVINHGDFWVNNMLFRYDNDGQVTNHIFVDFQLSVYGSPGIDLNYFLNTSPSDDVFMNHQDEILEEYLNVLTVTMRRIGCKTEPPSMTQLRETMRKTELVGLMAACVIMPIVRADKAEAQTLEEMIGAGGEFNNKGCEAPAFRKAICPRLQRWEAMGLLD